MRICLLWASNRYVIDGHFISFRALKQIRNALHIFLNFYSKRSISESRLHFSCFIRRHIWLSGIVTGGQSKEANSCIWTTWEDWFSHHFSFVQVLNKLYRLNFASSFAACSIYCLDIINGFLFRALQTAIQVFGSEGQINGSKEANIDNSGISSLKFPPIVAVELCRERLVYMPQCVD